MTQLIISCVMFAYQLINTDGRLVNSTLYLTEEACQGDADRTASQLEIPSQPCFRYEFCNKKVDE